MTMTQTEIESAVQEAVTGALGADEGEVTPDATLMDDLGAESIDLLDILFRLERNTGIKIQAADLGDHLQGGIPDEEFSPEGTVSPTGMEQLKKAMPQIDTEELQGKLKSDEVMSLFTVQNLSDMVAQRAGAEAG